MQRSAQCPSEPTAHRAPGGSNSCCSPCSSVITLTPTPPGCWAHEDQRRARSQEPKLANSSRAGCCKGTVSAHSFTPRLFNPKTLAQEHFQLHFLGLGTAGEHPSSITSRAQDPPGAARGRFAAAEPQSPARWAPLPAPPASPGSSAAAGRRLILARGLTAHPKALQVGKTGHGHVRGFASSPKPQPRPIPHLQPEPGQGGENGARSFRGMNPMETQPQGTPS